MMFFWLAQVANALLRPFGLCLLLQRELILTGEQDGFAAFDGGRRSVGVTRL